MISDNKYGADIFHLEIDETAKASMLETARWSKFLTIVFFIFFGLLVLGWVVLMVTFARVSENNNQMMVGFLTGVIAICLYVYPVYALYKFSTLLKVGLNSANQEVFNRALNYQKNMFKYMGILTIIGLVIYGLILVLTIAGLAAAGI